MIKKFEVLANIAVIVASIVLCSVLVKKYFFTPKQTLAAATASTPSASARKTSALQPGTQISLPGIDWSKTNHTLILALSTTCHFCSESAPFYQKLQTQKPSNVRIVAVLPQSVEDGKNYLNKLGVSVSEVFQASLNSISVSGTPTMMLMDNNGVIQASWVGKLSDAESEKVLARLSEPR